jgi:hypothetical protein
MMQDQQNPQARAAAARPSEIPANPVLFPGLAVPLPIDRVDFRVQSISANGWATLLAYKDARVDMDRLDEVVGRGFWERKHQRIDGREYCHVSVWNPVLKCWCTVSDVGVPSNTEAVKGEASDAFKRACVNLGIGRELYDYPLLLVQLKENEYRVEDSGGKKRGKQTFDLRLKDWKWAIEWHEPDETGKVRMKRLGALDENDVVRFSWPRPERPPSGTMVDDGADANVSRGASQSRGNQQQGNNRGNQRNQDNRNSGNRSQGTNQQGQRGGGQRSPQQRPAQDTQGQRSQQAGGDKPWFDDVETAEFVDWANTKFMNGVKADAVITELKQRYRLNRATENKIRDMAVKATQERLGNGGVNDRLP